MKMNHQPVKPFTDFRSFISGIKELFSDCPAVTQFDRQGNKTTRTFNELSDDAMKTAKYLVKNGLSGKHISLLGENCYGWLVAYLGTAAAGSVAVCLDCDQAAYRIEELIKQADTEVICCTSSYLEICQPIVDENKSMKIILLDKAGDHPDIPSILNDSESYDVEMPVIDPKSTASIVFTSGTEAKAKPVMLSHKGILTNAHSANIGVAAGYRSYSSLPFCHSYGMTLAVLSSWTRGAELIFNGNLKTSIRDMLLSETYSVLTVPLVIEALYKQVWLYAQKKGYTDDLRQYLRSKQRKLIKNNRPVPDFVKEVKEACFGTTKVILSGGAALDEVVAEDLINLGVNIAPGYGITECSPLVAVNPADDYHPGTAGYPLPGVTLKIENDEILIKSDAIMNGYYKMPEETAAVLRNGWFYSGDIGTIDRKGYVTLTGRKKNLIVFKNGKKIAPETLELQIKKNPLVKDCLVYGASDGVSADDVKVAVSIYPDPNKTTGMSSFEILDELQKSIDELNSLLPIYQQIKMVAIQEKDFERNTLQKIRR